MLYINDLTKMVIDKQLAVRLPDSDVMDVKSERRGFEFRYRGMQRSPFREKCNLFIYFLYLFIYFYMTYGKLQEQSQSQGLKWPIGQLRKRK